MTSFGPSVEMEGGDDISDAGTMSVVSLVMVGGRSALRTWSG